MGKVAAVAIGGALGALMRYFIQNWSFGRYGAAFPYGTLLVNLTGAFVIGIAMTVFLRHVHVAPEWRLFLVTGILGGYTTFSALAWETLALLKENQTSQGLIYAGASVIGGMICVAAGALLGNLI